MIRHIFEDPTCPMPDIAHPWAHAIRNLGAMVSVSASQRMTSSTVDNQVAVGLAAFDLLKAAAIDPEWARAILDAIPEEDAEIAAHNARLMLQAFPLSPLDKAVRG